ncbi:glycine--tRNA ligase beta subunit [Planctomyces bekefii]|uniref:Glycine--tRNA ligase beta subunit n=1 Tax=Planctomyces bekefii TaxID=1653850 RepID=A0A5C6M5N0_9PLAN|nr:glycine--tRNA ligase beta subunit [Planctomyces bekefii]
MVETNIGQFILELGCEELPAGQIINISNHIKNEIIAKLNLAKISFGDFISHYTPRRLYFQIDNLLLDPIDQTEILKGPPEKISRNPDGDLSQAGLGFAKKNNLETSDLYFEDGYLCAKKTLKGQSAKSILETSIPEIVSSTPGVRFMRWADGETKFARPIQWILAVIVSTKSPKQILDFSIEGLSASDISYGHRFLGNGAITVSEPKKFIEDLRAQGVILDLEDRKKIIMDSANKLADSVSGVVVFDENLLTELCLITENPAPILCSFDTKFLAIPDCVLKTVMIHHQRYLPIETEYIDSSSSDVTKRRLTPYFIAVSNNPLAQASKNIKAGNEKVIVPRFKDADFFVQEDMKISLEERLEKLSKLNFIKGTMLAKSQRLKKISAYIIRQLDEHFHNNPHKGPNDNLDQKTKELIEASALLAKADLSTNLVFEFTELQGEIGGVYALKSGLDECVAMAISDHYKPRFAGDALPSTIGAKILAIADKMDNLVCSFALGKIPSGSADPFALRRQANGLLEIILHSHLVLDISSLVDEVCRLQQEEFGVGEMITKIKGRGADRQEVQVPELNWQGTPSLVKDFLRQRLEFVFEIFHKHKEINKAVIAHGDPLTDLNKRHMFVHTLYSLKERPDEFRDFISAVSRIVNITKTASSAGLRINPDLFQTEQEKNLYQILKILDVADSQKIAYEPLLTANQILEIVAPVNSFFDNVLVNAEQEDIRNNRKALVNYANSLLSELADFSLL